MKLYQGFWLACRVWCEQRTQGRSLRVWSWASMVLRLSSLRLVLPLALCGLLTFPVSAPDWARTANATGEAVHDSPARAAEFTFAVLADMRDFSGPGQYDTSSYFRGACEALADRGTPAFIVSPGDIDPVDQVEWTIEQYLGPAAVWFPVAGNHELPGQGTEPYLGANMARLRSFDYPGAHLGPSGCVSTTYSFDHGDAHFVMLNEYCDSTGDTATHGDIPDHLYSWLAADLAATDKARIFVFGHEPAYPQPDADNGRLRHETDSLNQYESNRDRFWDLLVAEGVTAYICGHTHNYSAVHIDGVWQVDVGHARGLGDTGAPSTFVVFDVSGRMVRLDTYRDDTSGGPYTLMHTRTLVWLRAYLPIVLSMDG